MSILFSPISGHATDKNPKKPRPKSALGYTLESFIIPETKLDEANNDGSVVVDVSEEGHRLLEKETVAEKSEDSPTFSTSAFLRSRL